MTREEKQLDAINCLATYIFYSSDFCSENGRRLTEDERGKFRWWKEETKKLSKMSLEKAVEQCKCLQEYTDDIATYYIQNEVRMLLHVAIHGHGRGRVK